MDSLESMQHFKEFQETKDCPVCKEKKSNPIKDSLNEQDKSENVKTFLVQDPRYTLDDVFLPASSQLQIDEALAKIKNYKLIYETWGFKSVDPSGAGTVLNFYGKPGTGKTLTAEALAGTLGKKFISLGMSDVESKFMGETAKNIRAAFDYAAKNDSVLFFDEADTLLGARLSNVTQGIDNEVNSLRSTMLIELEKYEGIVIFATNFEKNYDKAFVSRITQHVFFDLPDLEGRRKIWDRFLVHGIPLDDERESLLTKLANISEGLSGRNVRTCMRLALPKAIHDADDKNPVLKFAHLQQSIEDVLHQEKIGTEVSSKVATNRAALKMLGTKIKEENQKKGE
ncbi:ATP-binding protein [Fibrobacter intestinalis]|nr:ATP-binding protein [Fibrobacter sp. NR9]